MSSPPRYKKLKPKQKQFLRLGCAALALTLTVGTIPFLMSHAADGDNVSTSDVAGAVIDDIEGAGVEKNSTPNVSHSDATAQNEETPIKTSAFSETKTVNGVRISVTAPEGVFPEGAVLSVTKVGGAVRQNVEDAVDAVRDDSVNVAKAYTFDIKVLDQNGNEIQPKGACK